MGEAQDQEPVVDMVPVGLKKSPSPGKEEAIPAVIYLQQRWTARKNLRNPAISGRKETRWASPAVRQALRKHPGLDCNVWEDILQPTDGLPSLENSFSFSNGVPRGHS